jgi:predicted kinase
MRKWMRERLQRRKKKPAEPSEQPAPPPLQPAYFDAEQQPEVVSDAGSIESEVSLPPQEQEQKKDPVVRKGRSARPGPDEQTAEAQPAGPSPAAPSSAAPSSAALPSAPISSGQAGRSRRRRGGRGRGGRGREQAVAQAFTPAAVKGSIPAVPAESAEAGESEDNFSDAAGADGQVPAPVAPTAPPKLSAAPAAEARAPKGIVVLAIGLPGSGKSTWFKRHNVVPLSSDMVRSLLFDDVREQRFQDLVFSNLRSMLKARLIAKRPMNYVDATNLTPQERQHWIKLAKDYQYEVHAVFFDVPLEVCLERHQRRDRVVPDDVMRRMAAKLKPPTFEEGIAKITVVRVKKKEPGEAG